MAAAATGFSLLGAVGTTASNVMASDEQAKIYSAESRSVVSQAAFDERQQRRQNAFAMGEANADTAAGGIDMTRGSPLLMQLDRAKQSEIQALSIRRSGQVQAMGLDWGARMARRQIPGQIVSGFTGGTQGNPGAAAS
ncbi:MAG: hypothetical protein ACYDGR_16560 [Candidatus Dormibacteria bacterium]